MSAIKQAILFLVTADGFTYVTCTCLIKNLFGLGTPKHPLFIHFFVLVMWTLSNQNLTKLYHSTEQVEKTIFSYVILALSIC